MHLVWGPEGVNVEKTAEERHPKPKTLNPKPRVGGDPPGSEADESRVSAGNANSPEWGETDVFLPWGLGKP